MEWVKIAFDITDNTNSIRVSKFMAKDQAGDIVSAIKTGMHLIVQGKISFDSYEKESILEPTAIVKSKKKIRMDNAPEKACRAASAHQYECDGWRIRHQGSY